MIRYIVLLVATLLFTISCSDGSDTETAKVTMSAPTSIQVPPTPTPAAERPTSIPGPEAPAALSPTQTTIVIPTSRPIPATVTPIPTPTPAITHSVNANPFWNEPMYPVTQKCTSSFQFTHQLVDLSDVDSIGVSPGGHIAPHGHMAYWGTAEIKNQQQKSDDEKQSSVKVQLYSPADIFFVSLGKNNRKELGGALVTCDGHVIEIGHVSDPSDEFNLLLSQNEPEPGCDNDSCRWRFPTFIPAGTPLFKSSGFTSGFDFGLTLYGLTSEELQTQPGYGYSITPWRTGGSGNAVCALEYFKEPLRSEYKKLLGDFRCGPFNQDVPDTAMGFWLDTRSTEIYPGVAFKDEWDVNEWETIWLFQDFRKNSSSSFNITVGNNLFGLDHGPHGEYSYNASKDGLVNRAWDAIKSGENYCIELRVKENMFVVAEDVHKILILNVSEDGKQLTVEALQDDKCGDGPWQFQGGKRVFYR